MKKAYILHGCCDEEEYFSQQYPSPSNFHYLPWLQKQLLMKGFFCQTPEMPMPFKPDYKAWKTTLDIFPMDTHTSLVGHSCGGGFLLRWLSENDYCIDKLILIAPWLDPHKACGDFLNNNLESNLSDRVSEFHVFYSEDEPVDGVKETVDFVLKNYPTAKLHSFTDKGHFCLDDMGTVEFPELLDLFN